MRQCQPIFTPESASLPETLSGACPAELRFDLAPHFQGGLTVCNKSSQTSAGYATKALSVSPPSAFLGLSSIHSRRRVRHDGRLVETKQSDPQLPQHREIT